MAAPSKKSKVEDHAGSKSRDAKVADIRTGSKSLADAADYSEGWPETMQHHISDSRVKGKRG